MRFPFLPIHHPKTPHFYFQKFPFPQRGFHRQDILQRCADLGDGTAIDFDDFLKILQVELRVRSFSSWGRRKKTQFPNPRALYHCYHYYCLYLFMHRVWQARVCMVHLLVKVVPLYILAQGILSQNRQGRFSFLVSVGGATPYAHL